MKYKKMSVIGHGLLTLYRRFQVCSQLGTIPSRVWEGGGSSSRIKLAYRKLHKALMSDIMHENHSYEN